MKLFNPKHTVCLYKMNRIWGDNFLTAAYYALRGKAFVAVFRTKEQYFGE
jgi:hypothetical protein